MGISFLVLAFAGLILVVLIVIIAVLFAGRRHAKTSGQHGKVCGHCQYPVRDLPSFTCPECGNDLRKVGIVSIAPRPRRKALTIAVAILAAMLVGGVLLSTVGYLAARNAQKRAVQVQQQAAQAARSANNANGSTAPGGDSPSPAEPSDD